MRVAMTTFRTQNSNLTTTGASIVFDDNDETWTVTPHVAVQSALGWGTVESGLHTNVTLINRGEISNADSAGVYFYGGGNETVVNRAGGSIDGLEFGIFLSSGNQTVVNRGLIIGQNHDGVNFHGAAAVSLTNSGEIYGGDAVCFVSSGGLVDNSGQISGQWAGVYLVGGAGPVGTVTIHNRDHGVIRGEINAISIDAGNLSLINEGRITGDIYDDGLNLNQEIIHNHGLIAGSLLLGHGNDIYDGHGGRVLGSIQGGFGDDHLSGGSKVDRLFGGKGNDTLTGGRGADRFVFDQTLDASTNVDTISDFKPGQGDRIVLSEVAFRGIDLIGGALQPQFFRSQPVAETPDQHILYSHANGFLFYDEDGSGTAHHPVHFATLANHPNLNAGAFLVVA
jgi:Ca2+-binding RTX toxin-like protein